MYYVYGGGKKRRSVDLKYKIANNENLMKV